MEAPKSLEGKYRLEKKIGAGGMGTIYRAVQLGLDRPAAIKFLSTRHLDSEEELARFQDEARVCSQLRHPNVVQIYDFDLTCDTPYLVLEYVEGHSLKDEIVAGLTLSVAKVCELVAQICDGLHHAHERGVVHRDIKPGNILINKRGDAKLADFGLAKLGGVTTVKTKTGVVMGTPVYMSPEQASELPIGPTSDIYSLAVLLYELLAGTPPLDGPNDMDILLKHVQVKPKPISFFNPKLHSAFDELLAKCLEKDPAQRIKSAAVLASHLRRLGEDCGEWVPGQVKISLGCRSGMMAKQNVEEALAERANKKWGGKRAKKPSTMKVSVLSSVSEELQKPEQGRKFVQYFAFALFFFILLAACYSYFVGSPPVVVRQINIKSVGIKSIVLSWQAPVEVKNPKFKINRRAIRGPVPFIVEGPRLEKLKEGKGFEHEVILSGLKEGTEYYVSLARRDGSYTLPQLAKTLSPVPFEAKKEVKPTGSGDFLVTLTSRLPFRARILSPVQVENGFMKRSVQVLLPAKKMRQARSLEVVLTSSEGDKLIVAATGAQLLTDKLNEIYDIFLQDRRSGKFYRMWVGEDGRKNELFQDGGSRYQRAGDNKAKVLTRFWKAVEKKLQNETSWYEPLLELTNNWPQYTHFVEEDLSVREAFGKAIFPLEVLQVTAEYYKLPFNEKWSTFASEFSRSFPLRYGTKSLAKLKRFPFRLLSLQANEKGHATLFDSLSPDFRHSSLSATAKERMGKASLMLKLELEPEGIKRAWLAVEQKAPAIIVLPTVDLNGKFLATYRVSVDAWRKYVSDWVEGNHYGDVLVSLKKPLQGFDGLANIIADSEKKSKGRLYHLIHEISPKALVFGINRAVVKVINGPSDGTREPVLLSGLTLYVEEL